MGRLEYSKGWGTCTARDPCSRDGEETKKKNDPSKLPPAVCNGKSRGGKKRETLKGWAGGTYLAPLTSNQTSTIKKRKKHDETEE